MVGEYDLEAIQGMQAGWAECHKALEIMTTDRDQLREINADLLAALKRVARKIDKASGSPVFTAREHNKLELLIAKAEGKDR